LPKTPNGKIDRSQLPAPPQATGSGGANREGTLEPLVARVFEELLGSEGIGADDEFFALGGHSLLAARVAARLSTELGEDVKIRDIFRFPRVSELSAELASRLASSVRVTTPAKAHSAERVVMSEFQGYHVNCYYHCLVQSLNYFESRPIHALNDVAAAFLNVRLQHVTLDPAEVLSPVFYREVVCTPIRPVESGLSELFGVQGRRFRLESELETLKDAIRRGALPILVGGTERGIETSLVLVDSDDEQRHFVALGNDFGVELKHVPYDSTRLRPGEEVLILYPPVAPDAGQRAARILDAFQTHLETSRVRRAEDENVFRKWLHKYASRVVLPEKALLLRELEGVNVTIGAELSGFLRFESHVIGRLPPAQRSPRIVALARVIERVLTDYQRLTNLLRRALLVADDLEPSVLNTKITSALGVVVERQRELAAARSPEVFSARTESEPC